MEPSAGPALAPHYYRDNFHLLCDTVEAQYSDLLTPAEQRFLQCYRELPFEAQCLYVRLVSRVGPWFRESKLDYAELGAVAPLVDSLVAVGMAETAGELAVAELGGLYTRAELLRAFGASLGEPAPRGKSALLAAIEALALDETRELLSAVDDSRVIAPCGLAEVALFQLLFFGNRRQGLTDFVLSDLGVARYYPYVLDRQHRLFVQRAAVEEYLACATLGDCWYELREGGDAESLVAFARELAGQQVQFPLQPGALAPPVQWHGAGYRAPGGMGVGGAAVRAQPAPSGAGAAAAHAGAAGGLARRGTAG